MYFDQFNDGKKYFKLILLFIYNRGVICDEIDGECYCYLILSDDSKK